MTHHDIIILVGFYNCPLLFVLEQNNLLLNNLHIHVMLFRFESNPVLTTMSDSNMDSTIDPSRIAAGLDRPPANGHQRRKSVRWVDEEIPGADLVEAPHGQTSSSSVMEPAARDWKRNFMISQGLPPPIIRILMTKVPSNYEAGTLEHACFMAGRLDERPSDALIQTVESCLRDVSVDDQRVLFDYLGWEFTCESCGLPWPAFDYVAGEFILSKADGTATLMSGPCSICSVTFGV